MSDATTPANPTDQIATTPAVLSLETPIVPTSGTKRIPDDSEAAVVQDAQQVIKQVTEVVRAADQAFVSSGGSSRHWVREHFIPLLEDAGLLIVPAAHIDYLDDLLNGYRSLYDDMCDEYASLKAERDALLDAQQIEPKPTPSARRTTPWLDRSILDAFCAECPSTACELPDDQAKCATLLLIGSIWARGTDVYYALLAEHEAWIAFVASGRTMDALTAFERAHANAERVIRDER